MDLTRPPRFSLKSLFVAIAVLSVPLAVGYYMRESVPNPNTLPIDHILGPDNPDAQGVVEAGQPAIVVLGNATELEMGSERKYERIRMALANPTPFPIRYRGELMRSHSARPPTGVIRPLYGMQLDYEGKWAPKEMFWCYSGTGELVVKPGHAGTFDVLREFGERPSRVGVTCRWVDKTQTKHSQTVWSRPIAAAPAYAVAAETAEPQGDMLFQESFDDSRLLTRNWYDGDRFTISGEKPFAGKGCIEYRWLEEGLMPTTSGLRRLFTPSESVYLKAHIRLSNGRGWTGRGFHSHPILFMTTENGKFHGPAASHLTLYIEPVNGKLRLAAQDIQNKDQPHGLTQGPLKGGYNGKFYDSKDELFKDDTWHTVEAFFQLNSLDLEADKPKADGIVRGWFDGKLVIEETKVVLRSTDFPKMKFNQFLLTPYFGPGLLPHAQTLWIDELSVGTKRLEADGPARE
jgi:hypothetical protein